MVRFVLGTAAFAARTCAQTAGSAARTSSANPQREPLGVIGDLLHSDVLDLVVNPLDFG